MGLAAPLLRPTVVSTNYWVLASILLLYLGFTGQLQVPAAAVKVGAITGVVFISSMLLMTRLLRTFRVASVLTAFRLAIVVPGVWAYCCGTSRWAACNCWAWAWRW